MRSRHRGKNAGKLKDMGKVPVPQDICCKRTIFENTHTHKYILHVNHLVKKGPEVFMKTSKWIFDQKIKALEVAVSLPICVRRAGPRRGSGIQD